MNTHKIRPFNHDIPNGRNHAGYGNTPPIDDESRNPYAMAFLAIVGAVIAIALVAW